MKLDIWGDPASGYSASGEYERGVDPRLQNCPFCDSDDIGAVNTYTPYYHGVCNNCDPEGPKCGEFWDRIPTRKDAWLLHIQAFNEAIAAWNTRP